MVPSAAVCNERVTVRHTAEQTIPSLPGVMAVHSTTDGGCNWLDRAISERNPVCHVYRKETEGQHSEVPPNRA